MNKPLISIIITTYKRKDKLNDAIESAVNQTYKNLEIIVVDDNSEWPEERTQTEEIVSKYKKIKLIKNEKNLGGALSRNVGIDNSNGKLISFLDDDDIYLPTRIEEMLNCYLQNKDKKVGLIYCSCDRINDKKKIIGSYKNNYSGLPIYEQMMGCIAGTSMWLAVKEALIDVGKFEQTPCKQDSILLLKLLVAGYQVYPVEKSLVLYYEHGGTGISGTKPSNIDGLLNYRKWCRNNYDKLSSKSQISNIESNFSNKLVTLYIINNNKVSAKKELKNILKRKPFSIEFIKALYKVLFSKSYLKKLADKK